MPNQRRSDDPRTRGQDRAQELLDRLGLRSLPIPVEKIAKSLGALVRFSPLDQELSGMIFVKDGSPIIGVNSLHHPNRQRFTIAHELAHLELHRDLISSEVHVDKQFPVLMRDSVSATGTELIEIEANNFAAALLMPKALLEEALARIEFDIEDPSPLDEMAKRFRVSRQTLEYRIGNMR
jgi:Zn-dependent peptidase ImmA (M78 family)